MDFIKKYKKKNLLKKLKENNNREKKFHYIEDCEKIAFIVNSDNEELLLHYRAFVENLIKQNKQIFELFVTEKKTKKEEVLPKHTISIADKKWIKSDTINKFVSEHYDILITVFENMVLKVQYLSALISADLKVSPNYEDFNTGDIIFYLKQDDDFNDFFDAINQYISKKNKNKRQNE